ncbi:T9SS type A sorting domain-containing protein [Rubrivirga sp.]|uniref:T9SS type A sorting domain-containing protein n=1 Tax=Rubrivirga sp. TaxID=1885344 RepID=UPI003B5201E5
MRPLYTHSARWLGVAALAVLLASPALAQRTVTLRMNSATQPDTVAAGPAADVQLRGNVGDNSDGADTLPDGNVIDWNDGTTLRPTNVGGDYWEVEFQIPDDQQLDFKFYIGQSEGDGLPGGWEDGSDHVIAAGTGDVMLDLHYFEKIAGDQPYDWRPFAAEGDSVAVWFRTYIDTEQAGTKGLDLDDGDLVVAVRGDNATGGSQDGGATTIDWGSSNVVLSRESETPGTPGYALFSGRVAYPASAIGTTQAYKFFFTDGDTTDGWEDTADGQNRTFDIPAQDSTLMWKFFGDSPANSGSLVTAGVTFQVDVSPLSSVGLFQISDDFVQVRGGFNGWDCPDDNQDDCLLQQTPGTADFARQVPITGAPGSDLNYKFYISLNNPDGTPFFVNPDGTENFDAGYEEPLDYGGGNRLFEFAGSDQALDEQFFNSVRPGNIIPEGQSVDVTFTVDMTDALTFEDAEGRAFDPGVDTVAVQFEDTFWLLTQGLNFADGDLIQGAGGSLIPGFVLSDDDGDNVYTGTLTVDGPTYNGIGYRYTFGNDTDGLQVEGTGGFDAGRRRYRYVTDVTADEFSFAQDTFRPSGDSENPLGQLPWEINPTGPFVPGEIPFSVPNGYEDVGQNVANEGGLGVDGDLALGAVYPNPTAGTARVLVTSATGTPVTVRVYDVTGRVVVSVVEDGAVSGRALEIDTHGLAAGLYLVRAESAEGVAVRRMTVVR